jgi:hypothetical protein
VQSYQRKNGIIYLLLVLSDLYSKSSIRGKRFHLEIFVTLTCEPCFVSKKLILYFDRRMRLWSWLKTINLSWALCKFINKGKGRWNDRCSYMVHHFVLYCKCIWPSYYCFLFAHIKPNPKPNTKKGTTKSPKYSSKKNPKYSVKKSNTVKYKMMYHTWSIYQNCSKDWKSNQKAKARTADGITLIYILDWRVLNNYNSHFCDCLIPSRKLINN